jgi:hypothetical protein
LDASADLSENRSIPFIDVGAGGPGALADAQPRRFGDILAHGRRHYSSGLLRLADDIARRWLERCRNPYLGEIVGIAERSHDQPGAFALNLAYEWSCTTGVSAQPGEKGVRMRRTLDWPMDGLGRDVVVARFQGNAGEYYNITWPGFVGVATGMAPGRFAAAINQPPLAKQTGLRPLDWALARMSYWRSNGLPAMHLLRRVFDECVNYEEAKRRLCVEPIAVPAFFTLAGMEPDEGCIIERRESRYAVREVPACISNHWTTFPIRGWKRGVDTRARLDYMKTVFTSPGNDFDWVAHPVLNETTRLAVIANAAEHRLIVRGFEADGPVTDVFTLGANHAPVSVAAQ